MYTLLHQQIQLRMRHASELILPPVFLLALISIVGLSTAHIHLEWVWVGLLLAILMQLPTIFMDDWQDGTLIYLQHRRALFSFVWAKFLAWWLGFILPILASLPVVAILSQLSVSQTVYLAVTLLFASPTLLWLGILGASLTLMARQNMLILIVLVLPLLIPVILLSIFSQTNPIGWLLLLMFAIFTATIIPFVIVNSLNILTQH